MLDIERQEKILNIIKERKSVTTKELQELVFASSSTIIRDLIKMEKQGLIQKTHGGAAIVVPKDIESALSIRIRKNIKEKNKIARAAASFIKNDDSIFIDSSSTSQALIPYIRNLKYLTVVTNGLNNALALSADTNASIYFIGGLISPNSNSAVGSIALRSLESFNANIAIFSASGINGKYITEHSVEQANVKNVMMKHANITILVCDSTKFGIMNLAEIAKFDDIDYFITDVLPPKDIIDAINNSKCKLIIAED